MSNTVTGRSGGAIITKKENVAAFVHDVAELECAIFTLDKVIEEAEEEAKDKARQAETELAKAKEELAEASRICKIDESYTPRFSQPTRAPMIVWAIITIVGAALVTVASIVSETTDNKFLETLLVSIYIVLPGLIGLTISIIKYIYNVADVKQDIEFDIMLHEREAEENKIALNKAKRILASCEARYPEEMESIRIIRSQIEATKKQKAKLEAQLAQYYALGVIPPDYRYIDCVLIIDQIFRNDLADTMREAIRIYEERVFRGEVVKGMNKICSMLEELSSGMAVIVDRLDSINMSVSTMSQDLYTLSQRYASSEKKRTEQIERLIEETKLNRYASERIQYASDRFVRYQRYKGEGIL